MSHATLILRASDNYYVRLCVYKYVVFYGCSLCTEWWSMPRNVGDHQHVTADNWTVECRQQTVEGGKNNRRVVIVDDVPYGPSSSKLIKRDVYCMYSAEQLVVVCVSLVTPAATAAAAAAGWTAKREELMDESLCEVQLSHWCSCHTLLSHCYSCHT